MCSSKVHCCPGLKCNGSGGVFRCRPRTAAEIFIEVMTGEEEVAVLESKTAAADEPEEFESKL